MRLPGVEAGADGCTRKRTPTAWPHSAVSVTLHCSLNLRQPESIAPAAIGRRRMLLAVQANHFRPLLIQPSDAVIAMNGGLRFASHRTLRATPPLGTVR